jgi:hypothetical protein
MVTGVRRNTGPVMNLSEKEEEISFTQVSATAQLRGL